MVSKWQAAKNLLLRKGIKMTPAQANDVGSKLIHLLSQQRLLYRQLRELAQKQSSLVTGENPEMLLRVLAGRQRIIDRLSAIDKELRPIRDEWKKIAMNLPEIQRAEAQQLVAEVKEILGEIIARDEKDSQAMSDNQQQVASEIKATSSGKRVNQAYAPKPSQAVKSRYLDTLSK